MMPKRSGFTLSELLIALAILGIIATFTIPKVLQAQGDQKNVAIAKEAVSSISAAYEAYKLKNVVTSSTNAQDLSSYLNYVKRDTTSTFDYPNGGTDSCSIGWNQCYRLHNGGLLVLYGNSFAGTASTNALWFLVDPDGKSGAPANGPDGLEFALYYSGRITTWPGIAPNTVSNGSTYNPDPNGDPSWFRW